MAHVVRRDCLWLRLLALPRSAGGERAVFVLERNLSTSPVSTLFLDTSGGSFITMMAYSIGFELVEAVARAV